MFKFLREKLKKSISKISDEVEEKGITEEIKVPEKFEMEEPAKEMTEEEEKDVDEILKELEESKPEVKEALEETEEEFKVKEEELKIEPMVEEEIKPKKAEEEKPKASFLSRLRRIGKKEEKAEEGFEEVAVKSEIEEAEREKLRKKKEEEKEEIDKRIREKVEEKKIPSIQELGERKEKIEELKEEVKEIKEEVEEEKEAPKKEEIEHIEEEVEELKEEVKKAEKGFFGKIKERIITKKISEKQFDDLFWDLEVILLENNVAVEVIEKIKEDLKKELVEKAIRRSQIESTIANSLKHSIEDVLDVESFDLLNKIKQKKPFVICFVGVNGSGKTTTIAKIARLLQGNKLSVILAASDTFRAASIEQLQKHADNLAVKMIRHDYGSDPAAVAYDAIEHAKAKNIDVVLIDTAGRMHSNVNLTDEMKKIVRVAKPDLKIFVGESITGNDCIEQAKTFNEAIGIDAIILAKADVDEKGGAAVSVSYVTKKPIIYLGTGQEYSDLQKFDPGMIIKNLGLAG